MALVGTATNRTSIDLPVDVSREIMQKARESSAVMSLARRIDLPGRGTAINVITSDPTAAWVGETSSKPVSNPGLQTKIMRAYKLAVIVPFSDEFRRDVAALYDALIERLPGALAKKFDEISLEELVKRGLKVVDTTASALALENKVPFLVFDLNEENSIVNALSGKFNGTKVTA